MINLSIAACIEQPVKRLLAPDSSFAHMPTEQTGGSPNAQVHTDKNPATAAYLSLPAVVLGLCAFAFSTFSSAAELLDINNADVETIASTLAGIGPAKAQAIVDYRLQNGTFLQVEDLTDVPGIGEATLEQIRTLITISSD